MKKTKAQFGGNLPGVVGNMYARIGGAPSNGKKAKKTKPSAHDGKVIQDNAGQWAHPGKITKINSNQITMKGVNYPVLGVSDTGHKQMMLPGQEYQFKGNNVTEYPMMQDGGWLGKYETAQDATKLVPNFRPFEKKVKEEYISEVEKDVHNENLRNVLTAPDLIDSLSNIDRRARLQKNPSQKNPSQNYAHYDYSPDSIITLKTGKFNLARVPKRLIKDASNSAKEAGIDTYQLLGLMGQESTFGGALNQNDRLTQQELVSGWNLADKYYTPDHMRFLADKHVPGVTTNKNFHGYSYDFRDNNGLETEEQRRKQAVEHLKKHPDLFKQYQKRIDDNPIIPDNFNYFTEAAKQIKAKGIASYNPGDSNYEKDVINSTNLLKQDSVLVKYLKKNKLKNGGWLNKYK